MRRVLALFLLINISAVYASNSLIAIVNNKAVSYKSIENKINDSFSFEEKISIIEEHIDILLQLEKSKEFQVDALKKDVDLTLQDIANSNNITLEQLQSYPEFFFIEKEVYEKISILNLQRFITKDLVISPEEIFTQCSKKNSEKDLKQIKIAQIIISELDNQITNDKEKEVEIKSFLNKISNHISKGASFETFAKLHSQHSSYSNGGLTDWISVNSQTTKMLDTLEKNKVSKIYLTDFGYAIAIKIDERFISSKLGKCEEELIYVNAEEFYFNWVSSLRENAFIKIYEEKL